MLKVIASKDKAALDRLMARRAQRLSKAEAVVRPILEAVRKRGDAGLLRYARKLDGLTAKTVKVPKSELERAAEGLSKEFGAALDTAGKQIRRFAELQMPRPWVRSAGNGVTLGQIVRPLNAVGAYIPAGRYPLPSTILMTVIPAQVAEVPSISVACPRPSPQVLGTAGRLGVENLFQMGGAQAIAAFAFGTETVPRAERIVGPGNIYVTAAKKLLAGEVGIDFVAGPTEIVLISADGDPRVIAADMLAQAEHDVDACAILLTTSRRLAAAVVAQVREQLQELPTRDVAATAISRGSAIVVTRSLNEAVDISNRFAPEHLTIHNKSLLPSVSNAGSVFIGQWSPEAAGDYAAGPNHVLPTAGAAAVRGGLSVLDYIKIISVQQLEPEGLKRLAPAIVTLARAEGLEAHARSIEVRFNG